MHAKVRQFSSAVPSQGAGQPIVMLIKDALGRSGQSVLRCKRGIIVCMNGGRGRSSSPAASAFTARRIELPQDSRRRADFSLRKVKEAGDTDVEPPRSQATRGADSVAVVHVCDERGAKSKHTTLHVHVRRAPSEQENTVLKARQGKARRCAVRLGERAGLILILSRKMRREVRATRSATNLIKGALIYWSLK